MNKTGSFFNTNVNSRLIIQSPAHACQFKKSPVLTPYFKVSVWSTSNCSRDSGWTDSSKLSPSKPWRSWWGWWKSNILLLTSKVFSMWCRRIFTTCSRKHCVKSLPSLEGNKSREKKKKKNSLVSNYSAKENHHSIEFWSLKIKDIKRPC